MSTRGSSRLITFGIGLFLLHSSSAAWSSIGDRFSYNCSKREQNMLRNEGWIGIRHDQKDERMICLLVFITMFTRADRWSLSWACWSSPHPQTNFFNVHFNIIFPSKPRSPITKWHIRLQLQLQFPLKSSLKCLNSYFLVTTPNIWHAVYIVTS
jgi:hypothetical protein